MLNQLHTDCLFALFMNDNPVPLEKLAKQITTHNRDGHASIKFFRSMLSLMEEHRWIKIRLSDGVECVELTEYGKEVCITAADVISTKMLLEWQHPNT